MSNHEKLPGDGKDFKNVVMLLGKIDREQADKSGAFTTLEEIKDWTLDDQLDLCDRIAESVREELKPYWQLGLEMVILHGDEILTSLIAPEKFDYKKFGESSQFVTVRIHRPLTVLLLSSPT